VAFSVAGSFPQFSLFLLGEMFKAQKILRAKSPNSKTEIAEKVTVISPQSQENRVRL
jgi:hypothetical protein